MILWYYSSCGKLTTKLIFAVFSHRICLRVHVFVCGSLVYILRTIVRMDEMRNILDWVCLCIDIFSNFIVDFCWVWKWRSNSSSLRSFDSNWILQFKKFLFEIVFFFLWSKKKSRNFRSNLTDLASLTREREKTILQQIFCHSQRIWAKMRWIYMHMNSVG